MEVGGAGKIGRYFAGFGSVKREVVTSKYRLLLARSKISVQTHGAQSRMHMWFCGDMFFKSAGTGLAQHNDPWRQFGAFPDFANV